jgi:hypothetical protein
MTIRDDVDDESVFHCDIYVTQQSHDPWSRPPVRTTTTAPNDATTRYHWGCRPDVPSILAATAARVTELHQAAFVSGHTARVAVVACGPTPLVAAAKRAAREQSRTGGAVVFDFHEEIFDY